MSIPAIKLNPKDIYPILNIIRKYDNDKELMKKEIHKYLSDVSPTGSISFRNAVYALSFHTLRTFKLIAGRGNSLHLSQDGDILLSFYEHHGYERYHKELSRIVFRIDEENANVIGNIAELNSSFFSKDDLIIKLIDSGIDDPNRGGKLTKWLRLLKYLRFIDEINDELRFNRFQLESIKIEFKDISLDEFYAALKNSYNKITKIRRGNPYVSIPEIENDVCYSLINYGFTTPYFRKYLVELSRAESKKDELYFAKPGARESNGLRINGIYYFYIALFEGKKDGV